MRLIRCFQFNCCSIRCFLPLESVPCRRMELIILSKFASHVECRGCKTRQKQESTSLQNPANWNVLLENANYSVNQIITGDKRSPRPFGPSITRNLITRVLTICHVKLTQSTALEQKRFDLRSLSPALRNLWLLLVCTRLACMFCFPNRGPRGTWPFVFS